MDPTAAEMLELTTVQSLCVWAGVSEDLFAWTSTQIRGKPQHIRQIASIPYKSWDVAMHNLKSQTPLEGAESPADPPTHHPLLNPPESFLGGQISPNWSGDSVHTNPNLGHTHSGTVRQQLRGGNTPHWSTHQQKARPIPQQQQLTLQHSTNRSPP
jgi:hypothetical protein